MKKKAETSNIIRSLILVLCLANVLFLLFVLRQEAMAKSNAEAISYSMPEDEAEEQTETALVPSPVLILDESQIPDLQQNDLYALKDVLVDAQALRAEDGQGNDITDQIEWHLIPVENEPGTFDADFTVRNEYKRSAGASLTVTTELTAPFLMLTSDSIEVAAESSFSISPYIAIAIDTDGDDLTEYVSTDDYVNTYSPGTYNITIYVYSREVDAVTKQNLTVTVK